MIIVFSGMAVGFCFDFYRILRWQLRLNKILTFIGDLLFSLWALGLIYFFAQKANYLELRFYLFLGSLLGVLLYLAIFSRVINKMLKMLFRGISAMKTWITRVIFLFFRGIYHFIAGIMSLPYCVLRRVALLVYRMGEAFSKDSITRVCSSLLRVTKR